MSRMSAGCRSFAVAFILAGIVALPVVAHPGSGIIVDRLGQVYFVDTGSGLWKIDTKGALSRITAPRFHWMTADADNRFGRVQLPAGSGGEITRVGSSPTLLLASDVPLAIAGDGNLYYPARSGRGIDILRLRPSGGPSSVFTSATVDHLNGLAAGPDGSLFYTENRAIRRINAQGQIATVAANITLSACPLIPGMEPNDAQLRGLAVDASGTVYVAASGCGSVLKVTPGGRITTVLQLESPWSPTAVALFGQDIYVLEYLHTAVEDRLQWLPRVRKIAPDGKTTVIASVTRG